MWMHAPREEHTILTTSGAISLNSSQLSRGSIVVVRDVSSTCFTETCFPRRRELQVGRPPTPTLAVATHSGEHVGELQHVDHNHQAALSYARRGRHPCSTPQATNSIAAAMLDAAQSPPLFAISANGSAAGVGLRRLGVWLVGGAPPPKCLLEARSYLCGLNASTARRFVGIRRQPPTTDTMRA